MHSAKAPAANAAAHVLIVNRPAIAALAPIRSVPKSAQRPPAKQLPAILQPFLHSKSCWTAAAAASHFESCECCKRTCGSCAYRLSRAFCGCCCECWFLPVLFPAAGPASAAPVSATAPPVAELASAAVGPVAAPVSATAPNVAEPASAVSTVAALVSATAPPVAELQVLLLARLLPQFLLLLSLQVL